MTARAVPGQQAMDAAPEWREAPGQVHLFDLIAGSEPPEPAGHEPAHDEPQQPQQPRPCGVRYSDTQDGPLASCALPAGHSGRHAPRSR